jgi:imidazolonepropionase-like amidohydrolase
LTSFLGTPDITGRSYEYYKNSHLLIRDGKIERISSNIADVSLNDAVYDVEGLLVTPGIY